MYSEKEINKTIKKNAIFSGKFFSFERWGFEPAYIHLRNMFGDLPKEGSTNKYRWYTRKVDQLCNIYIEVIK